MSLFLPETVACPACGAPVEFAVVYSINADRRPDLRDGVLDGTFQEEICEKCDKVFRLEPEFSYLDVARKQWLLVQPAGKLAEWSELEQRAKASFDKSYGPGQAPAVQALGRTMQARVTFGWAAFREKLLAAECGLDDVVLELVKLAIIRGLDDSPLADDTELRLVDLGGNDLVLAWIKSANESAVEVLTAPRALYDEIVADTRSWKALRDELSKGTFVDLHRLLIAPAAVRK
jgi:CpXC protein